MAEENITTPSDWQTEKSTVLERNSFMFLNEIISDVRFRVGEEVVPAHKYVLATSSPVFFAMFFGPLAEKTDEIEIVDSKTEDFKELLRFLYTDQAKLTLSTVESVINLAEKYMIPSLKRLCAKYLEDKLSLATVLKTLPIAQRYNENDLTEKCLAFIRQHTEEVMEGEDFTEISAEILKLVLKEDKFTTSEVKVFHAASRWAEARCVEAGEEVSGPNKRRKLGDCVQLIRFPTMSSDELVTEVLPTDILTMPEVVDVSRSMKRPFSRNSEMFNVCPRNSATGGLILRCCRGVESSTGGCTLTTGWEEVFEDEWSETFRFSVDTGVVVIGCGVFGSKVGPTTVAELCIKNVSCLLAKVTNREFTSFLKKKGCGTSYHGFDVLFDKPVKIQPGKKYIMSVRLSGVVTAFTVNKEETVTVHGVQFKLKGAADFLDVFSEIIFKTL